MEVLRAHYFIKSTHRIFSNRCEVHLITSKIKHRGDVATSSVSELFRVANGHSPSSTFLISDKSLSSLSSCPQPSEHPGRFHPSTSVYKNNRVPASILSLSGVRFLESCPAVYIMHLLLRHAMHQTAIAA